VQEEARAKAEAAAKAKAEQQKKADEQKRKAEEARAAAAAAARKKQVRCCDERCRWSELCMCCASCKILPLHRVVHPVATHLETFSSAKLHTT
jgi:hypothetical protein